MKRFIFVVAFCTSLLAGLALFLFPVTHAAENPLIALLDLPAPPPPNPQVTLPPTTFPENFFNRNNPPPDDAPIEYLMAYWRAQAQDYREIRFRVYPSPKVLERLFTELAKSPGEVSEFLNIFPLGSRTSEFVKNIHDRFSATDESARDQRAAMRRWMKYNTPHYSAELEREAARVSDSNGYVLHHDELIALARVDWDRAGPIVSRLYNNPSQKASHTAALWALYLHAIEESSLGDTERYREELKEVVADKSLSDGIRDLALDALSLEKEWNGRDEWYLSLLEDETLLELGTYTGLTTLPSASPDEKYIDRMIALLDSDNINVRTAAARNLVLKLNTDRPDIVKALVPWLTNEKWLKPSAGRRDSVIQALSRIKVPEAVPALILALDEKTSPESRKAASMAVANAMNAINAAARAVEMAANSAAVIDDDEELEAPPPPPIPGFSTANAANSAANVAYADFAGPEYPLRYWAISALAHQGDGRAVPALRRILNEVNQPYEQSSLIGAIQSCGGFTIAEQVDAIEDVAKNIDTITASMNANLAVNAAATAANLISYGGAVPMGGTSKLDIRRALGLYITQQYIVREDLARAVVDRITSLDRSDPKTAEAMRRIVTRWHAPAVNALLLRDLKAGRTTTEALVKLLAIRKDLRTAQQTDVFDTRTGSPIAVGISACLIEEVNDYEAILDSASDEAKTALLACARMIRAPLPIQRVAENLQSKDKLLALAAERYLESEDSPEARRIVLSLHPNEAKILGAKMAFNPTASSSTSLYDSSVRSLLATVNGFFALTDHYYSYNSEVATEFEDRLREEVKKDTELLGIYAWQNNVIHVYKDKAMLSWHDDPARYRERVLAKEEFDNFKGLIAHYRADELPAFLACTDCGHYQLLMLGKYGGRRVYVRAKTLPPFFAELDAVFTEMRQPPSTIRYWAGKDIPGLEVVFSDDQQRAVTAWKNGPDLRVLAFDKGRQAEIAEAQVEEVLSGEESEDEAEEEYTYSPLGDDSDIGRAFESFGWFNLVDGKLGPVASQPPGVEFIPLKDSLGVNPSRSQWKARVGTTEVRVDGKGLYKVSAGKVTKIKTGIYSDPVTTPNGRWVVATKYSDGEGVRLVRINLLTNKEFVVQTLDRPLFRAVTFIPSINRMLVGPSDHYYGGHYDDEDGESTPISLYSLLDPETGSVFATRGDIGPLTDQTFRPLQQTANQYEFWAAVPNDTETVIGVYSTRTFSLKPVLKLPKIKFNSMGMWVDEPGGKAYFAYEGHLLAVPIQAKTQ